MVYPWTTTEMERGMRKFFPLPSEQAIKFYPALNVDLTLKIFGWIIISLWVVGSCSGVFNDLLKCWQCSIRGGGRILQFKTSDFQLGLYYKNIDKNSIFYYTITLQMLVVLNIKCNSSRKKKSSFKCPNDHAVIIRGK